MSKQIFEYDTDEALIISLLECETITEWNDTREKIKAIRDTDWIVKNIDVIALINRSAIKNKPTLTSPATAQTNVSDNN